MATCNNGYMTFIFVQGGSNGCNLDIYKLSPKKITLRSSFYEGLFLQLVTELRVNLVGNLLGMINPDGILSSFFNISV